MRFFSKKAKDDDYLIDEIESKFSFDPKTIEKHSHIALTPEEVCGQSNFAFNQQTSASNALEHLKNRIKHPEILSENENIIFQNETEKEKNSLVDKCMPYFIDDNGNDATINSEPIYKLESVVEILKSDSEETIKRLSEKYGIPFNEESKEDTIVVTKTYTGENSDQQNNEETPVSTIISDIDIPPVSFDTASFDNLQNETVTFTPVSSSDANKSRIYVSTKTQNIDLTGELIKLDNSQDIYSDSKLNLETNDFDEYIPKEEFTDQNTLKKLIRSLSIKKKNSFIVTSFTLILTLLILLAKLPLFSGLILTHTVVTMSVLTALFALEIILNAKMFVTLPKIFSKSGTPDCLAALACISTLVYCVVGILNNEVIINMLILSSVILFFRALANFQQNSYLLSNLKQISSTTPKYKVKLISDTTTTYSMAKDCIEGDQLIAAPQKVNNISNYMKYSTYNTFLNGKLPIITILAIIVATILGFACASYFNGLLHGLFAASAVLSITCLPSIFLIDNLPLYDTAKKLNKVGAMIAGKAGANEIEMANATVLNSNDIFPEGTVTLHQMEILCDNSLDDTLIRAASLTEYIGSTLAPIFKNIAKTGNITVLPDADTVKYEDRMGISGWVDNRLLFIGNRTLMEAHGIEVPSVEIDRRILRKGYFPVYVATGDKACALLMVQYLVNTKVAHELKRLTGLGVTLLVNNTDPNLTNDMICDYLGLYEDTVMVMSAAGSHMYKNSIVPVACDSAPATYKSHSLALPLIINSASRIKFSNILLTVCYIIASVLGILLFAYSSLGGLGSLASDISLVLYAAVSTVISYLIYLIKKP